MASNFRLEALGQLRLTAESGVLMERRRKELAVLVILADRAPRAIRREQLQDLFWGERDEARARSSLRQALLQLRRALGADAIETTATEVRLPAGAVDYDVRTFEELAHAGRPQAAVAAWTGDFLVGCEDAGAEAFRSWLDAERARLRTLLHECHAAATADAGAGGGGPAELAAAAAWAQAFPLDEAAHLALIAAHCRHGRAGDALQVRAAFERRLSAELDVDPGAKWWYATEDLLREARARSVDAPEASSSPASPEATSAPAVSSPRWKRFALFAGVLLFAAALGIGWLGTRSPARRLLAVGHIELTGTPDSLAAVPLLIGTSLGRIGQLRVLSESRIREVLAQLELAGNTRDELQRAARAAGADEVIEGMLSQRADGRLRLDLRRIDLRTGEIGEAYLVESGDVFDLIDDVSDRIARDLGGQSPAVRLAGSSTSLVAYRFYEEGLRAFYDGDHDVARRLFRSAVAEDSTFAMAGYYAARTLFAPEQWTYLERAARMAERLPDRERLLIQASWAAVMNEPSRLPIAETLAVNYPAEPAAQLEYANALSKAGHFARSARAYRRVIELDSLGLPGNSPRCLACDAYPSLVGAYMDADSMDAAERTAREWLARQPESPQPWRSLAHVQNTLARYDDALASHQAAARLGATSEAWRPDFWLRTGNFVMADQQWRARLLSGSEDDYNAGLDHAVGSLRIQGRTGEALEAALRLREVAATPVEGLSRAYHHAMVLYELGRFREAAALFDSISVIPVADSRATFGRQRAWSLSHSATAYAAAGDTARLRALEDTVRSEGAQSGYARDQRLFHYVRGLRLRAAGDDEGAARALRTSIYSPIEGNIRASYELARTLVDLDRPAEAIAVLTRALGGPIGSTGTYINRSEIVLLLGQAHELAGQPDSARVHYAWVARAWRSADEPYRIRRAALCARRGVCDVDPR